MSSNNDGGNWIMVVIVFAMVTIATVVFIHVEQRAIEDMQEEAVEMGHARWVGEGTGDMKFEWLEPCEGRGTGQ